MNMMMRLARAAALAALVGSAMYPAAAASDGTSTTSPETDTPDWLAHDSLYLTLVNSATPGQQYTVLPLTSNMGLNGSANSGRIMNIQGHIILADEDNFSTLNGTGTIAYLCCDNADKKDNFNIDPNKMLTRLMDAHLSAIILYSANTNWCSFDRNNGPPYSSIVTMADKGDAADVLTHIQGKSNNGTLLVSIKGNTTVADTSGDSRSHSTVAMSVLYSITGLITLLFLAIIITGTVRAHRHPERYGPHAGIGRRPRQSRAKGIARAVLDTLPIVKFGNDEHAKPDPELELEPTATENADHKTHAVAAGGLGAGTETATKKEASSKEVPKEAAREAEEEQKPPDGSAVDGEEEAIGAEPAGAESARASSSEHGEEHLGCSICTEDFTVGEDVRVLPCNHQFHPGCVDPWLVNVSGTCPLCRYDLQPGRQAGTPATETAPELPPPLALEAEDNESTTSSRNRASRLFEMNRLRNLSQQDRIAALRAMRNRRDEPPETDEAHGQAAEDEGEENGRATRLAAKLRDKFRIRTRAQT
ncbi:hypothetical protein PWT90_09916 [Aphanocladium album]|nr:hypothetical protein PWT90_09916 [Aphanocladium album]